MSERQPIKHFGHPDKPHVFKFGDHYRCKVRNTFGVVGFGRTIPEALASWLCKFHEVVGSEPTIDRQHNADGGEPA